MSLMRKLLDALKMESTREMENNAVGFVPDADTAEEHGKELTEELPPVQEVLDSQTEEPEAISVDDVEPEYREEEIMDITENPDSFLYHEDCHEKTMEYADNLVDLTVCPQNISVEYNEYFVQTQEPEEEPKPYKSHRLIIQGVHLYFIDIAREIVSEKAIKTIPLMREYRLTENELNQIIDEIQEAKILDLNREVTMSVEELEKFIDIYEPCIFDCANSVFDKEIFMVMGEIIFDKGIEDTYNALSADEVIDYLNVMEKLHVISYDAYSNKYSILASRDDFYKICECIPSSFSNTNYEDSQEDYSESDFDNMSGIEFEKYCAHILSKNGFQNIKLTPASGDHGIDILAEKDGISYAIQCKCYSSNIGNFAVQEAHTGKSLYHKDIAVVLTNRYFTPQAVEEAQALGVKLWNRDKLNNLIEKAQ